MIQKALFLGGAIVVLMLCLLGIVGKSAELTQAVATQQPQAATMAAETQVGVQNGAGLLVLVIVVVICYFLFRK